MHNATVFLLPNFLSQEQSIEEMPSILLPLIPQIDALIVENEKEGRRYLQRFPFPEGKSFRDIPLYLLNEHTKEKDLLQIVDNIHIGEQWGVISDAGLPCIADPGSHLVWILKKRGITIKAIPGPSSLILALMLSGLSGQKFAFHGYLPREPQQLTKTLCMLEKESQKHSCTQIFIEAPYRSSALLQAMLSTLQEDTVLSISASLTSPEEISLTGNLHWWKKASRIDLQRKPAVFLLHRFPT